ncbi:ribonuclease H-like domain-containing protein [Rhodovarius lipocyclicus]|uniref:ribonuclease H-like domain-containing protein n=1 Tax=Rhodovarius lipocyclicus TaxID=268410 RepID=UPI00135AB051|nr:ribonuclease H-like domain-containing protein [Rhodovarius lipocyclicus]
MTDRILVLDIETVPDLATGRTLLGAAAEGMDDTALRAALGARYARAGEDPAHAFLKAPLHRLVVLGVLRLRRDGQGEPWQVTQLEARGTDDVPEAALLERLDHAFRNQPVLVGFNTQGFDLPVLRYRAMALGVAMPNLFGRGGRDYGHRYGNDHIDLCDRLSGHRASTPPSLAEAAALLGLDAKSFMGGAAVEEAAKAGKLGDVAAYCEQDVVNTWALCLRWMLATGLLGPEDTRASMAALADHVEEAGKPELLPLLEGLRRLAA